ncbi:phenoloxidase-activating factor 2 [Drosophila ficusphila]|uniref:phenoloxidase-activating factor 2 n=1 Tax=Drosophila ficusphila TaxID=30025 RepID=UPI0007E7C4E0|nr:phenoloxidase-activating factor 2 [Drosophila ficusphila]XP_017054460.1 phenoloxidase-activating factor 2 [Drosophila ficusphila]XP_017054463.1 phenoloxidase-activating factor 2 [Drosophila ficusphila]XP_043063535.1 phenoloxidase-activating factor 2 [Drosophila ficusphila]
MARYNKLWSAICVIQTLGLFAPTSQQNSNAQKNIEEIFNTNPSKSPGQQGNGIGFVVTPEPIDSINGQSNFNSTSGRSAACNCVPYYKCDPSTNSVTEDGSFDGFGVIDIRFNADDPICPESVDVCCADNRTRSDTLNPTPLDQRPNQPRGCGVRNTGGLDFTLSGATQNEAGFGEFPWTVALLHIGNLSYFCAGSLIHQQVVLTAVHCLETHGPGTFMVRAGEWDSQTTNERLPYQERAVKSVIRHPQYKSRNIANDFALVILSQSLTLDDHINVICLPQQEAVPAPATTCFSTGWGKDVFGSLGKYSVIMKRVPLPIVDFNSCQARLRSTRLGTKFALDRSFICAGGQRGTDTCQGDGGAPLACPIGIASENRYQQSGIVAWGIGCNDEVPAAYANVALAKNWIDQQMLANGFGTSVYTA